MPLPDRLRAAIQDTHDRIEAVPFSRALVLGRITLPAYITALARLAALHRHAEAALARHPELRGVYDPETMNRADALRRDLAAFGADPTADPTPDSAVHRLAGLVDHWSSTNPWALLGLLYVLEGSRLGSMVLWKPLSAALGVPAAAGAGLDYHLDGLAGRPASWQRFKARLAGLPLDESTAGTVVAAAAATMAVLLDLYSSLPSGAADDVSPAGGMTVRADLDGPVRHGDVALGGGHPG